MQSAPCKAIGFSLLVIVSTLSIKAHAQYYGGFNFEPSRYAATRVAGTDASRGFFLANTALGDNRTRYGLRLGYEFSPYLALASRYAVIERSELLSPLVRHYGIDLESRLPVWGGVTVSGSAGISRLRSESVFGSGPYSSLLSGPGMRATNAGRVGVGMQYQFNSSLGLRFDAERYRSLGGTGMGELGADHLSLGIMLKF